MNESEQRAESHRGEGLSLPGLAAELELTIANNPEGLKGRSTLQSILYGLKNNNIDYARGCCSAEADKLPSVGHPVTKFIIERLFKDQETNPWSWLLSVRT